MRNLVKGDRVKITGPWVSERVDHSDRGEKYIGEFADVIGMLSPGYFKIHLDHYLFDFLVWCRENLRALPRRKQ